MALELKDIARELEVATTWHTGARGRKLRELSEALWEHAGGRQEPQAGDVRLATPGPGVRTATTDTVEVDSVGQIADATPATQVDAAKTQSTPVKPSPDAKTT